MRHRYLIGAAVLGIAAAIPATAGATSSTVTANCEAVTVTFTAFGPPPQALARIVTTIDGIPSTTTYMPSGPVSVYVLPLNLTGTHTVGVEVQGTATNAFSSFPVTPFVCGTPIVPPAFDVPGPPPLPEQPLVPAPPVAKPKPKVVPKPKPKIIVKRKRPVCGWDFYLYRRPVAGTWTCKRIVPDRPERVAVTG